MDLVPLDEPGPFTIMVTTRSLGDSGSISVVFHDFPTKAKADYAVGMLHLADCDGEPFVHTTLKLYRS